MAALSFTPFFVLNYTNYQAYASEKSKNYIVQTLLEGAKNKVCNLFPNKHIQMYEDINEMLDGDIDVTKKYYNQVGRFYDMYHNTLVKLNQNIMGITIIYVVIMKQKIMQLQKITARSKAVTWQQLHLRKKINFYLIM